MFVLQVTTHCILPALKNYFTRAELHSKGPRLETSSKQTSVTPAARAGDLVSEAWVGPCQRSILIIKWFLNYISCPGRVIMPGAGPRDTHTCHNARLSAACCSSTPQHNQLLRTDSPCPSHVIHHWFIKLFCTIDSSCTFIFSTLIIKSVSTHVTLYTL